ncbi:MAG: SCP2 sterol-binding domain-containing protein [Mycobacteriales bacterium]
MFTARLDPDGVHDLAQCAAADEPVADVRLSLDSDDLVALANGSDDFLAAWLRGRVHVSASMRDMLRLRSLFGL